MYSNAHLFDMNEGYHPMYILEALRWWKHPLPFMDDTIWDKACNQGEDWMQWINVDFPERLHGDWFWKIIDLFPGDDAKNRIKRATLYWCRLYTEISQEIYWKKTDESEKEKEDTFIPTDFQFYSIRRNLIDLQREHNKLKNDYHNLCLEIIECRKKEINKP